MHAARLGEKAAAVRVGPRVQDCLDGLLAGGGEVVVVEDVGLGAAVRCDVAVEAPGVPGNVLEQPVRGARGNAVDGIVCRERAGGPR